MKMNKKILKEKKQKALEKELKAHKEDLKLGFDPNKLPSKENLSFHNYGR